MSASNAPAMRPAQRAGRQWRAEANHGRCRVQLDAIFAHIASPAQSAHAMLYSRHGPTGRCAWAAPQQAPLPRARLAAVRRLASGRQQPGLPCILRPDALPRAHWQTPMRPALVGASTRGRPVARADATPAMESPMAGAVPWAQQSDRTVGLGHAACQHAAPQ